MSSTQDLANWYNAKPEDRGANQTIKAPSVPGSGSGKPSAGFITPGKAGGEKTTSNPTVYPIAAPETAAGSLLGKVGIKSSDDMITIALFGGLVILFMSLFKG